MLEHILHHLAQLGINPHRIIPMDSRDQIRAPSDIEQYARSRLCGAILDIDMETRACLSIKRLSLLLAPSPAEAVGPPEKAAGYKRLAESVRTLIDRSQGKSFGRN